ncbi:hypothetical protein ABZZ79_31460 [Streptomyces sp. NPDC006458]|uniref:hypothetical protein n=1 Tax=Streptomyces sp. NPDC006458 TaxID=3154302 RepID=UPI0033BAB295
MESAEILALPYVDTHTAVVAAGPEAVWRELGRVADRSFSGGRTSLVARLLGCADRTARGPRPLAEGSALAGFRVAAAVPGHELALVGRHRFSSYALVFRLDEVGEAQTRVRAETRARFPGPAGAVYRGLVIGTGGHRIAVRRMLAQVERRVVRERSGG